MSAKWTAINGLAKEIGVEISKGHGYRAKGEIYGGDLSIVQRVTNIENKLNMLFSYLKVEIEGKKCTEPKIVKAKKGKKVATECGLQDYINTNYFGY